MDEHDALSIVPFVPSGEDYAASRRLFSDLGFEEIWESEGYAGFVNGGAQFILQRLNNAEFARNLMIKIVVPDLDVWWARVSHKRLDEKYHGVRLRPPAVFPWGREVHFIDLAGVCWHIGTA